MEFSDEVWCVLYIFGGLPRGRFSGIVIAEPLNAILEFPVVDPRVHNCGDFVFGFAVDFHRRWWGLDSIGYGISFVRAEKGDMEDGMELGESMRKGELISVRRDFLGDGEWAQAFMIELLGRTFSFDIGSVQPDFVGNFPVRRCESSAVGGTLGLSLGCLHLVSAILMEFRELMGEVMGRRITDGGVNDHGGFWVVAVVGKEGGDLRGGMRSIVVGKLGDGEEVCPIVLLVVAVHAEECFQDLVNTFGLAIGLGVIGGGEVELHAEELTERGEEL